MTTSKAHHAILYLILGFVAANLALAMRMNATATFRKEMVDDLQHTNEQLQRIEANQEMIIARQKTTMKKLNLPFPSDDPATQP